MLESRHIEKASLPFSCILQIRLSLSSVLIINKVIIFNIYIAEINMQEDMTKCTLHIKTESKITMLPVYNFEFTIKCEDINFMKH